MMRPPSRSALCTIIFLSTFSANLFAQTTQKLTEAESNLVNQPKDSAPDHPLHDYVACTFHPGDRDALHRLFLKTGSTAVAVLRTAIEDAQLSPQKTNFLNKQADLISKMAGINLSNVGSATTKAIEHANAEQTDTASKLSPEEIAAITAKTNELANAAQTYVTPNDIGCSESVLTYNETKDIFGRRIADTYIAVQVTLRNLNPNSEYLLHDIQVAVKTDLFFNTRDRRLARGVAEIGQQVNPRNETFRYIDAGASALSIAAVPVGSMPFSDAAHGFSSFLPALKAVFPDYSIAQLGRLDDLGFSSGSLTYVIPKSGAHSVVVFIPEKIYRTAKNSTPSQPTEEPSNGEKYKDFKNYTTADLKEFQNDLEILVAGVHIQPVPTSAAAASSFSCDDPKADTDTTITCHLGGKNLDSLKAVKLAYKTTAVEESVTSTKYEVDKTDSTKATVTFDRKTFEALKKGQTYTIVLVGKDDSEVSTSTTFSPKGSSSPAADATGLDCDAAKADAAVTCHLTGKNLQLVKQVKLVRVSGGSTMSVACSEFKPDTSDPTKATVTFTSSDFADLKGGQQYSIVLVSQDGADIKTTATFTPKQAALSPQASSIQCGAPQGAGAAATVTCQIKGSELQLVKQAKLVSASGTQAESATSSKFLADSADYTKASATFAASALGALKAGQSYRLVLVPTQGTDVETTASYVPKPATPSATAISCDTQKPGTSTIECRLQGKNLQLVKQSILTLISGQTVTSVASKSFALDGQTQTKGIATFAVGDFENLKKGQTYRLVLVTTSGANLKTPTTYTPK